MTKIIIKPKSKLQIIDIAEILRYRELFYIFSWRDIKVRYKQTFFGIAWAVFQPLINMFVFTFFFGKLAKIPSNNIPYPLFVLIGLVFWTFFSGALTKASTSLIENENLLKKVYFPRVILPASSVITSLVDFVITLVLLFVVIIMYGQFISPGFLIFLLVGTIITFFSALGLGLLFSAINVKYRDVRYILPFFIQILMFLSPVIYPLSSVSYSLKYIFALNPLTGVIESTRAIIGNMPIQYDILLISLCSSIVLFLIGLFYFRLTEKFFADII